MLHRGKLAKSINLFQSKYDSWYQGVILDSNSITGVMQAHVYSCVPRHARKQIFGLKSCFGKYQDDFNSVGWSNKKFRRQYISIYIPHSKGTSKTLHTMVKIWRAFVTIRKQHISFHVDLPGTQTSRTWRKNIGLCFLVHARKRSDGMPKHCIIKFAIEYDITGVTIGRNFAQYIDLSFYIKMDIHAQNRTCNINHSWKSINVIENYFTLCLQRCKVIVCCNQQRGRAEIRNARNILSLFFYL